jgi:hypothetical protein
MSTLAVTFQGPFVYSIEAHCLKVYAPKCADHHAAVFTVDDESPRCGRARGGGDYIYELEGSGIQQNSGAIIYPNGSGPKHTILDAQSGAQVDTALVKFCIQVPWPKIIYGSNTAYTEVVKSPKPSNNSNDWATGLRFYYDCDLAKPISLKTPERTPIDLSAINLSGFTDYADIDFRHVGPDADDPEHTDAIACFDEAMKLINHQWWLSYGRGNKLAFLARTGSDCRSPAVILGR